MKRLIQVTLALAIIAFSFSMNSFRQLTEELVETGTISGQVLNIVNERPVAGAMVTVSKGGKAEERVFTDANGFFKIPGLSEEVYDVVAEKFQFDSLMIGSVPVVAGIEVTTHFILTPQKAF